MTAAPSTPGHVVPDSSPIFETPTPEQELRWKEFQRSTRRFNAKTVTVSAGLSEELSLEELARAAHLELACAPFAELLTRATGVLRTALADAGIQVGAAIVSPASLAAGLPGVAIRRALADVSAPAAGTMPQFQVTALVVADLRQTGSTAFSLSLQFEARCVNELMFLKCAPVLAPLNPELRYRKNAGPLLARGAAFSAENAEPEVLERMASQFCVQLSDWLAP